MTAPLPDLPSDFGANDSHVEFALVECRQCHERSEWVRIERDDSGRIIAHPGEWHSEHVRQHGAVHQRFYQYTLTRNMGRTLFL